MKMVKINANKIEKKKSYASKKRKVEQKKMFAQRVVRNFWINADVDGRSPLKGGPKSKDGGISIEVLIRDGGSVSKGLSIEGIAKDDGTLELTCIDAKNKKKLGVIKTKR